VWSKSSNELFFRRLDGQLVTARLSAGDPRFAPPVPVGIGEFTLIPVNPGVPAYDTFPDGRFLLVKTESDRQATRPLVVVLNWISSLSRK
jgi:hypothetical protein